MIIQQEAEINFNGKKAILTFEIDLKQSHIKNILKKGKTQIRVNARKIFIEIIEKCPLCRKRKGIVTVDKGNVCMECYKFIYR